MSDKSARSFWHAAPIQTHHHATAQVLRALSRLDATLHLGARLRHSSDLPIWPRSLKAASWQDTWAWLQAVLADDGAALLRLPDACMPQVRSLANSALCCF